MGDGRRSPFEFRRGPDGWQRRRIGVGVWLSLHVERVSPSSTHVSADRGPRDVVLAARSVWTWQ